MTLTVTQFFSCRRSIHKKGFLQVTVLKKKTSAMEKGDDENIPRGLSHWVSLKEEITTGCSCVVGGSEPN